MLGILLAFPYSIAACAYIRMIPVYISIGLGVQGTSWNLWIYGFFAGIDMQAVDFFI